MKSCLVNVIFDTFTVQCCIQGNITYSEEKGNWQILNIVE